VTVVSGGGCSDGQTTPTEFRQRAVELARLREKPVNEIAANVGSKRSPWPVAEMSFPTITFARNDCAINGGRPRQPERG